MPYVGDPPPCHMCRGTLGWQPHRCPAVVPLVPLVPSFTSLSLPFKRPHTCPVCLGRGRVAEGFYAPVHETSRSTGAGTEACRACRGAGVIWEMP